MSSQRLIAALLLAMPLLAGLPEAARAQRATDGVPYGLRTTGALGPRIATVRLDNARGALPSPAGVPKSTDGATPLPHAYGRAVDATLDVKADGTVRHLPNGGRLWLLRVVVPGARGLRFVYDRFRLPPGARFFVYDEEGRVVRGAFTARNNAAHGGFATDLTPGERAVLEYYEPPEAAFPGRVRVATVVRAERRPYASAPLSGTSYEPSSLPCSINTACPEGDPWSNEARATVLIDRGGSTCTGVLLNNTNEDFTPYILTAHHCGAPAVGDTLDWLVTFNYASPGCADPDTAPPVRSMAGVVVRAAQGGWREDYALLELLNPIPPHYEPFFAGWSRATDAPALAVTTSHPKGDIRKITFEHDRSLDLGTRWLATFDAGTIESGSSGAPLFDDHHRVVGHVRGAWSIDHETCSGPGGDDNAATIVFPKLAHVWDAGPEGARVADFLDPAGLAPLALEGRDGAPPDPIARPWISEVDTRTAPMPEADDAEFVEIAGPAGLSLDGYRVDVYACAEGATTRLASEVLAAPDPLADEHDGIGFFVLGGPGVEAGSLDQPFAVLEGNRLPDGRGLILLRDPEGREVFDYQYDEVRDGRPAACPTSRITRSRGDDVGHDAAPPPNVRSKRTPAGTAIGFEETAPDSPTASGTSGIRPSPGRPNAQALPVELTRFDAVADGTAARLAWSTASETDNAGFEVQARLEVRERGRTGAWKNLGFVEGAGTTTEPQSYTYTARGLEAGTYAFRLRQINVDGTATFSPTVEVAIAAARPYRLSAPHPNPFRTDARLTLTVAESQHVRAGLYDVLGRRVASLFDGRVHAGEPTHLAIDASALPSGLYFVRIAGERFAASRRLTLVR